MLSDWSLERHARIRTPSLASTVVPKPVNVCTDNLETHHLPAEKTKIESAALIIIGDEILNGLTTDTNLQVTSTALQSINIPLKMVSIITDDINEIAHEVIRMSQKYDIVITSGGIGPTHDDVTIKAIAKALQQEMKMNIAMLQHLEDIQIEQQMQEKNEDEEESGDTFSPKTGLKEIILNENDLEEYWRSLEESAEDSPTQQPLQVPPQRKLSYQIDETMESFALLPKESILHFPPPPDDYFFSPAPSASHHPAKEVTPYPSTTTAKQPTSKRSGVQRKTWPILQCDNIYILPGVPQYFADKMQLLAKYFLKSKRKDDKKHLHKEIRKIVLNVEEKNLIQILNSLVNKYSSSFSTPSPLLSAHPSSKTPSPPLSFRSPSASLENTVKFGSYPFIDHPEYKTIITLESYNQSLLDDAMSDLIHLLPSKSVLRVEKLEFENGSKENSSVKI
jgi:molybdenum cofactor synthesis domain-containing protein